MVRSKILEKVLEELGKLQNFKIERYNGKYLAISEKEIYYIYFYRQRRNLSPSHLKSLIEFSKEEINRINKEGKDKKIIIILGTKLTENSKKIVKDLIKGENIFIFVNKTKEKYFDKEDAFFNKLVEEIYNKSL